nr:glycerate kinase [Rhabdothermincola salaria]
MVAPDKFKSTATAVEVTEALVAALARDGHEATGVPMADGGEGFLDALGGPNRVATVRGPLGEPVEAAWRLHRRAAVIEMARASGLALVGGPEANDPIGASTAGTGELIALAVESGATRVLVGVGGSATTDGGLGALEALHPPQRLRGVELVVACDVTTSFVDAAAVFGPQKGASPAQVELLSRRLARLAQVYERESGIDVTALVGAGAAGGLAGGLATVGADLVSGFEVVAEEVGLDELMEDVDLVVTGEGFLDQESFAGKVVGGVTELAAEVGVPVLAVVGEVVDPLPALPDHLTVVSLSELVGADASRADPCAAAVRAVLAHCGPSDRR